MTEKQEFTFQLFAPNNAGANLIADFNDWGEIPMTKTDDGYFRATVELPDGTYQYKFNVRTKSWFYEENEWKSIADPYATDVANESGNSILKLKDGRKIVDEYEWRSNDVPLPENNRLVIYELHVGDFSGGEADGFMRGKYTDVVAKLDYLAELGVNALELMPLKESPGDFNWGYSPIHYFAPESSYGTTAELKELIDKCHGLGIRVIVDGVYNHANTDTPLAQIDHDYWFHHEPKDPEQSWGPEFNYEFFDERRGLRPARNFICDSIRFWINEYQIDGIRFDAARQIDNFDALRSFVGYSREMASMKPFFTVAEYIPPTPEVTEPEGPVESCWNDAFMHIMIEYLTGAGFDLERIKDAIDAKRLGYANATSVTNYLANHDQNRLFLKLGENGILGDEAYQRARLGALVLLTAVGVPMIWMGEEFGEHVPLSEQSNKINWTLLETDANRHLFDYYRTLIALRTSEPAFFTANVEFFHEDATRGVLGFVRYDDDGNAAAVVVNLSDDELEDYAVENFPEGRDWHEWTKDYDAEIIDHRLVGTLERRAGLIFVKK
ncbi:MAG: alpha-amylase [Acidobacteria bacterium]|nr:alpha-amylase [Acidobacteriota bacterium]